MMTATFQQRAKAALANEQLQTAIKRAKSGFIDKRRYALQDLPEFEALREQAAKIKQHTLNHLDTYLSRFEAQVQQQGGQVHWAETAEQARTLIVDLCHQAHAQLITKGKSMAGEEIGINNALMIAGFEVVETDLGEYIIQLAEEPPSHIIAPAVHKTRQQISDLFYQHHQKHGFSEKTDEIPALVNQARQILRQKFLNADVGITGANFLIAETGSMVLVTNEGNGDLTNSLPPVHIVIASIEKVIPSLDDLSVFLRLLGRSATGQTLSTYTTLTTGSRRETEVDGPQTLHVVLVDNGRSTWLGTPFQPMLQCIRCGACLNHCPVYSVIGGHAYHSVYPGPMGSVLTPLLQGLADCQDLPQASSLCGRCEEVCPVKIPLPRLLRQHRFRIHSQKLSPPKFRWGLGIWGFFVQRPWWYHKFAQIGQWFMRQFSRDGHINRLPGLGNWQASREMPTPQKQTFMQLWQKQNR